VLTRGIDLNSLVGRRFTVGGVEAEGVELAEPCTKLQRITGEPGVLRGLVHRGGLRATIISGGRIAVGDAVGQAGSEPDEGR
jgi:MOSC domain-containing protein YiiM